jgi:hypothetical protein
MPAFLTHWRVPFFRSAEVHLSLLRNNGAQRTCCERQCENSSSIFTQVVHAAMKGPHMTFGTFAMPLAVLQPVFAADVTPDDMCYQQQESGSTLRYCNSKWHCCGALNLQVGGVWPEWGLLKQHHHAYHTLTLLWLGCIGLVHSTLMMPSSNPMAIPLWDSSK